MVGEYLLRLAVMLPLICAMIWGGLWLAKKYNLGAINVRAGNARAGNSRPVVRLTDTVFLSPGVKLAVVEFADKRLLLAVTRTGANLLSETALPPFKLEDKPAEGRDDAR